ncbi:MAG TPA: TetR/AcrR family transcriptional regulator [Xanthobacteraceae bacterium]|nr:TetR/AcrR family transcriptional regulator [Xanthobacteraceae bacterium]
MVQKKSKSAEGRRAPGRPRQYDPDQALAKAAETFWKKGYAATSLDDLVAATGMQRPSLYAAFGDKQQLYLKTLERYQQRSRAMSLELLADHPSLRVFLKRFYQAALDIYRTGGSDARGCYSISTAPAQAITDSAVRDFLAASIGGTDAFLRKQITRAQEQGEVAANADAEALAQLATATLHTIAVRSRVGVPRKQLMSIAAAAIDMICGPLVRQQADSQSGKSAGRALARG